MRDIGKNIRDLRISKNMTQDELSEKLFITRQTLSNYENSKTRPDVDMIAKIAEVLGVDANTVFYGPPVPEERKAAVKRLAVPFFVLAGMAILLFILMPIASRTRVTMFFPSFIWFLKGLYAPVLFTFAGWFAMELVFTVFKIRPLGAGAARIIRTVITVLLIFVLVLALLFIAGSIYRDIDFSIRCSDMEKYGAAEQDGSLVIYALESPFLDVLCFSKVSTFVVYFINFGFAFVYLIPGALLRLGGFPKKKNRPHKASLQ